MGRTWRTSASGEAPALTIIIWGSQSMLYYDIHSAAKFFCSGKLTPAADFATA